MPMGKALRDLIVLERHIKSEEEALREREQALDALGASGLQDARCIQMRQAIYVLRVRHQSLSKEVAEVRARQALLRR
ncbi:hypothetical protein [Cupriavidus plantarum]|uniref:hypothetical protein n=1 Tax=Cupriavidus plantarum TaxID=942865 RepID=UPI0018213168|nr:hypothetical protein [Cupriavidus plantarum]NYI02722.1 hypothetical protein [Cupriavidus plantarum]